MKVLMALLTASHSPYLKRLTACRETWMQHKPNNFTLWVISGPKLGMPDSYEMMSYKIKALFRRATMTPGWDRFCRVDDDVYVNWPRIEIPHEGVDYGGIEIPLRPGAPYPYCAGAVTWFSRRAVEKLAVNMKTERGLVEDREVGRVMSQAGMSPTFYDYPIVVRRPRERDEITGEEISRLRAKGFLLEVGSRENMRKVHEQLGLVELPRNGKGLDYVKREDPRYAQVGAIYRDIQGRIQRRNIMQQDREGEGVGAAVARPLEDPGWKK